MVVLTFILAVIALVIAILAYHKAGGLADLKRQFEQITSSGDLKKSVESLAATTESLKEKTAEAIAKIETAFKKEPKEEKKPARRPAAKRPTRRKRSARPRRPAEAPAEETPSEEREPSS